MKKFKYLDHTSEAKFQAFGNNLAEAFANACLATSGLMVKLESVKPVKKRLVRVESTSAEALLYDLLDEIIFIVDVDLMFISRFDNPKIEIVEETWIFEAHAYGDDVKNCVKAGDVKAPTYDDMIVDEDNNMVQAVVDV